MHAFMQYGLPDHFYCDNGNDYISVARGARDIEMEAATKACRDEVKQLEAGVLQRLGIPVTFCLPYNAQAKGEERWHNTLHNRFDRSFCTYTAGETHLRPDATNEAQMRHGKLLRMGRAAESSLPLASDFVKMCRAWIASWYHQQKHSGRGMDGRTPAEVFEQERRLHERPCPDYPILAMLLPERKTRKVSNCQIELDGDFFVPAPGDHYADFQMHERSGRSVTVAYDPLEPLWASVLDADGNFLCRLERKDMLRFSNDQETRDQIAELMQKRNGLRKAVRGSIDDLSRRVLANGYTTLEDQMRERLQLPQAVGDVVVQKPERPQPDVPRRFQSEQIAARFLNRMNGGL
jgi:hypothetical protein